MLFFFFLTVHLARVQHPLLLRLWWLDRPIRTQPGDQSGRLGTLSQVPAVRSPELRGSLVVMFMGAYGLEERSRLLVVLFFAPPTLVKGIRWIVSSPSRRLPL